MENTETENNNVKYIKSFIINWPKWNLSEEELALLNGRWTTL